MVTNIIKTPQTRMNTGFEGVFYQWQIQSPTANIVYNASFPITIPNYGLNIAFTWTDPAVDNAYSTGDTIPYVASSIYTIRFGQATFKFHIIRNINNTMGIRMVCLCW